MTRAIVRVTLVACALAGAACSGGGDDQPDAQGADAGPDAVVAPGPITVVLKRGTVAAPTTGVQVIFHNPDGSVALETTTNDQQTATAPSLASGSAVTFVYDADSLVTVKDLEPNHTYELYALLTEAEAQPNTIAVSVANVTVPGATKYTLTTGGCGVQDYTPAPSLVVNLTGVGSSCVADDGKHYVAAVATSSSNTLIGTRVVAATGTAPNLTASITSFATTTGFELKTTNAPPGATQVSGAATLERAGRIVVNANEAGAVTVGQGRTFPFAFDPAEIDGLTYQAALFYANPLGIGLYAVRGPRPAAGSGATLDLAADFLPRVVVTYAEVSADQRVDLRAFTNLPSKSHDGMAWNFFYVTAADANRNWTVYSRDPYHVRLPALPASLSAAAPARNFTVNTVLWDADFLAEWGDVLGAITRGQISPYLAKAQGTLRISASFGGD